MGGFDLVPRVPLTLPVVDKVPVPPSPGAPVLGGFQCTSYRVPMEQNEEKWVGLLLHLGVVVGCYPTENPLASGGRAGGSPREWCTASVNYLATWEGCTIPP